MKNVHSIFKPNTEPNPEIIQAMRELLELAENGRLQSFIGVGFLIDGMRISSTLDCHRDINQMLGAIEWIKTEYIQRHIGESC